MTISAKFPSRCACCGGNIRVGEQIEWTKGSPAVHAGCVGKPIAAAAPKAPRAAKPAAPKVDTTGCQYLSRRSNGRDDSYDVGQVLHAPKIAGGGGDGHYWTVVKVERKWKDDGYRRVDGRLLCAAVDSGGIRGSAGASHCESQSRSAREGAGVIGPRGYELFRRRGDQAH